MSKADPINSQSNDATGPISRGVVYPLTNFHERSGLGRHALREARKLGLKVRRLCGRAYVVGDDFLDFLITHGVTDDTV